MITIIKKRIKSLLNFYGYDINSVNSYKPVDLRNHFYHPRQLFYSSSKTILINAPTEHGRIRFFPLQRNINPYVLAAYCALNHNNSLEIIKSILKKYFELVRPKSLYDWFGMNINGVPNISNAEIWATPEPWKNICIDKKRDSMIKSFVNESKCHGITLSEKDGDKFFGPITDEKLAVESKRLNNVMVNIRSHGWRRHDGPDGDIEAQILIKEDGSWRWQVTRGLHRSSVLSALNWENIPIRVKSIVFREDVDIWPNVLAGTYSQNDALTYFDQHFDASLPKLANNWIEKALELQMK